MLPPEAVDRATAPTLRRTTSPAGGRGKRCSRFALVFARATTIRTLDELSIPAAPAPVVILQSALMRGLPSSSRVPQLVERIKLDLSWVLPVIVALSVTLALAILLEIFRQNG